MFQLKKITKYQLKFNGEPWITSGIQKSISIKNKHLKKLIRKKDPQINAEFHEKYKTCKSCTLMKKNKQTCYTQNTLKVTGITLKIIGKVSKQ